AELPVELRRLADVIELGENGAIRDPGLGRETDHAPSVRGAADVALDHRARVERAGPEAADPKLGARHAAHRVEHERGIRRRRVIDITDTSRNAAAVGGDAVERT